MIIKRIIVLSALLAISLGLKAASTAEDCAAITDDTKRLQCYDTFLKKQKAEQSVQQDTTQPEKTVEPTISETQPKTITETQPAKAPEPELTEEEKFGAEQLENSPIEEEDEVEQIQSRAIGLYKMWEKGIPVTLENGQVWEIIDYRSAYHMIENPKITIEKNIFGGYRLGVEGLNKRFRVKRKK